MRYLSPLLPLLLTGCIAQHPISKEPAVNNGYYVYFTNCNGEAIARTDSTAVKNTTRNVPVH